jgi:hypothetical protein
VDMTRFDVQRGSLVEFLIHSKEHPVRFQKRSESQTWSPLIERIKKRNPVFKFFWNKVDKPPSWKKSSPDDCKKVLDDYNKVKTSVDAQPSGFTSPAAAAQPSKITSPVVRKASLKLAHW